MKKQMGRLLLSASLASMVFCGALSGQALAAVSLYNQEGEGLYFPLYEDIHEGCTMIPLRAFAEYYGAEVKWQPSEITVMLRDTTVWLQVGKKEAFYQKSSKSPQKIVLDYAPMEKGDKVLAPLRLFTETMGMGTTYKNAEQAILLGETAFDETSIFYERVYQGAVDEAALAETVRHYQAENELTLAELWSICDRFLGYPLTSYFAKGFEPQTAEKMQENSAYYFADGVMASHGWKAFATVALTSRSDLELSLVDVTSTRDKISGTFVVNLFSVLYDIPLVFEAELTRKDNQWLLAAPADTLSGWDNYGVDGWQITKISNIRSYLNVQALQSHEPHIYEKWQLMQALPKEPPTE